MKATVAAALLAAWIAIPAVQAAQPASTVSSASDRPVQDSVLAAESFLNSAVDMTVCSSKSTPARAARLVVLTRFAHRLNPGDWRPDKLLADIYFAQADPNAEVEALEAYLQKQPDDYAVRLRWLMARLGNLQNVAQRDAVLRAVAQRKDLDASVRAYAEAMLANLLLGQARTADATQDADKAVALDPYNPTAVSVWGQIHDPNDPQASLSLELRTLRASPRAWGAAWQIGMRLDEVGLADQAIAFFRHVWTAKTAEKRATNITAKMAAQYASTLMDANEPVQASTVLEAATNVFPDNPDLQSLLIEAYRSAGKVTSAEQLIQKMAQAYKDRTSSGVTNPALSAELGWFYATTQANPSLAYVYAGRAVDKDPNNPIYQRILGAAELIGGSEKVTQGMARLEKLLGKDIYASVLLAGQYQASGDKQALRKAVLAGIKLATNGPAWRNLRQIAAKNGIAIPTPAGQAGALELLKNFPPACLEIFTEPNECVSIQLNRATNPERPLICEEPIEIDATIKNVSATALPLGQTGAMNPRMSLSAKVVDSQGRVIVNTARLPLVVWAAPRALSPGKTVTCRVRLDVSELAAALAPRPLEDLTLTISGTADPGADGKSRLPGLKIEPLTIARKGLLGPVSEDTSAGWKLAYQLALGRIVYDYRRGKLPDRMRAARQIVSMLAFADDVEHNRQAAPGKLKGQIDRLVLLSMLRAVLADRAPAVRAEAARAISVIRPDAMLIGLLAPLIEDPAAMVRCRLVETLAATNSKGYQTIVNLMSRDRDDLVRAMADAFE